MYCEFYGMRERPFNVTADPKFLYLNARYREALASLHYGVTQRRGFITLIGEAGTGKTTLLKKLLNDLDPNTRTVFVFNTNVTFDEILEYIFGEFDLPVHNGKRLYMLQRLNAFLLDELREGRNVALLVDEAQDLDYSVLEDLRLLSNLETSKEKILQIVLAGQPELGQKLSNPGLRQLRQRVAVNCRLMPLTREELTEYIQSRLGSAGCGDSRLFSREAEERVFEISAGIPRIVNVVCDNALVIGYAMGKKRISADVIDEASSDLIATEGGVLATELSEIIADEEAPAKVPAVSRHMSQVGMVGVVAVAIIIGLLSIGRSFLRGEPDSFERTRAERQALEVVQPGLEDRYAVDRYREPMAAGPRWPEEREPAVPERSGPRHPEPDVPRVADRFVEPDTESPWVVREEDVAMGDLGEVDEVHREFTAPAARAERPREHVPNVPGEIEVGAIEPHREAVERQPPESMQLALNRFQYIEVFPEDSISGIAIRYYGQASPTILDLMKMANPAVHDINSIGVGQTLRLPQLEEGLVLLRQSDGRHGLLLMSTPSHSLAKDIRAALRRRGFGARIARAELGGGRGVWRVIVGDLESRAVALEVGKDLQRLLRQDRRITALAEQ
jgi:type II secretory pathway predicted ATPase ExeA